MKVNLCDICDFQGGSQPPKSQWTTLQQDGYIRMLQIRDFTQPGKVKAEYVKLTNTTKCCLKDDILIARYGASLGKILTGLSGAYNVAMTKAVPNEAIISKNFLYYFLCSDTFQNCILNVGVRAAQAGFNKEDLSNIELYCPDLSIQNKMCKILESVDVMIIKSKLQLDKLDLLVKSRFIEMFGDPVSNPHKFTKVPLSELADIKIGPFGSLLHKEDYIENGHPVVNPSHIVNGNIVVDSRLTISDEKYEELAAYKLDIGDVVLGRRGEMGRCAVVPQEGFLCGTGSVIIRTKGEVTSDYIQQIISFPTFKRTIEDMAVGQTMPNLNVPIVSNFLITKPPVEIQKRYYDFVEQVDKSKLAIQQSLDELETLKKSLMQQYFG